MPNRIKPQAVLIVEDNASTAELEKRALARMGMTVSVASKVDEAVALLKSERFDAVLLDYQLPGGDPWAVLDAARSAVPRVPVILVTAMGNEQVAAEAIHRGVSDYVKKSDNFLDHLPGHVLRTAQLAQAANTSARLAAIVEFAEDAIIGSTLEGVVTDWNRGAELVFGWPAAEIVGKPLATLARPADAEEMRELLGKVKEGKSVLHFETKRRRKDGTEVDVALTLSPILDAERRVTGVSGIARDITARIVSDAALKAKIKELELLNQVMLDREDRIVELKAEIKALRAAR